MNTVIVWILLSIPIGNRPATVIHKFPDAASCQQALIELTTDMFHPDKERIKCIPAKTIIKREEV